MTDPKPKPARKTPAKKTTRPRTNRTATRTRTRAASLAAVPDVPQDEVASARLGWEDRFLQQLRTYGSIYSAAKAAGVGRSTVYEHIRGFPDFARQVQEVREDCIQQVEGALFSGALQPDGHQDRRFYLQSQRPEVYGDKLRAEQVAAIREAARQSVYAELASQIQALPEGERDSLLAAMAKVGKVVVELEG